MGSLGLRYPVAVARQPVVGMPNCPLDRPLREIKQVEFPRGRRNLLKLEPRVLFQGLEVLERAKLRIGNQVERLSVNPFGVKCGHQRTGDILDQDEGKGSAPWPQS